MLLPLAVEWVSFRRYNKTALLLLKRRVLTVWATSMHFDRRPRWRSIAFPQPGLPHHIIHSLAELFIRNFPISSFISLFEQMFPKLVVHLDSPILFIWIKDLLEIFFWQLTIFVHIKKLKSLSNVFLVDKGLSVNTCRNELLEVYNSVAVHITFLDDLLPVLTGHILVFFAKFGLCYILDVIETKSSPVVFVQSQKFLLNLFNFFLGCAQPWDQRKHYFLELV